jgi:SAM-dependent methyltransferase
MRNIKEIILDFFGINIAGDRARWVKKTLLALPRGLRILDVGAGETPYKKWCRDQSYVAQDFSKYDGSGDGVGLHTGTWDRSNIDIVSDITAIPEPDASFDVVLCTEVLEHVPDPVSAIAECNRLLKKGGIFIITAPFTSMTHFAPYHFCTGFNRYFYEKHLAGYEIEELAPQGSLSTSLIQQAMLFPRLICQYGGIVLAVLSVPFVIPVIVFARLAAVFEGKSNELLCFAYFVRARKK